MRLTVVGALWLSALSVAADAATDLPDAPPPLQRILPLANTVAPLPLHSGIDAPEPDLPLHPPFDEIPPMPMPVSQPPRFAFDADTSVTVHDARSGATRRLAATKRMSASTGAVASPDYEGADGHNDAALAKTFGNLVAVSDLTSWPQRSTVKLIARFTTTTGSTAWFSCTGSMADAGVVQTAAHCVYARDPSGLSIFNWADEIIIYPAWDGIGPIGSTPTSTQEIGSFGWARGTYYMAGTDYINTGNFDRDAGIIRIDRGSSRMVGVLTGWLGSAWGGSCGFNQGRPYYNYSYPAESCGGGLHTGRTMYFWSGGWDTCVGNQLQINTSGGCFNAGWGGMSGSGAYYSDAGGQYLHAVCSNSDRSTISRYALLWQQFTIDRNAFVADTRGTVFDFEALRLRARGSTQVAAGNALDAGLDAIVANNTQADPPSADYVLRVYLSNNNVISAADTLLDSWLYTIDVAPMQSFLFGIPAPAIPAGTLPGTYWIGAILDPATDAWPDNNDTSTWDAQRITVLGDALFGSGFEF